MTDHCRPWTDHGRTMDRPWTDHRPKNMGSSGEKKRIPRSAVGPWLVHGPSLVGAWSVHTVLMTDHCRPWIDHGRTMDQPWTDHRPWNIGFLGLFIFYFFASGSPSLLKRNDIPKAKKLIKGLCLCIWTQKWWTSRFKKKILGTFWKGVLLCQRVSKRGQLTPFT